MTPLTPREEFDVHVALGVARRHVRGEPHPHEPMHYEEFVERARLALVKAGIITDTHANPWPHCTRPDGFVLEPMR